MRRVRDRRRSCDNRTRHLRLRRALRRNPSVGRWDGDLGCVFVSRGAFSGTHTVAHNEATADTDCSAQLSTEFSAYEYSLKAAHRCAIKATFCAPNRTARSQPHSFAHALVPAFAAAVERPLATTHSHTYQSAH